MADCKTPEQIAAEAVAAATAAAAAAARAAEAAEAAKIAAEQQKRAEDDTTSISMVPISIPNDQSTVKLTGLFFNRWEIREEDEPESGLTIPKDILDRSSGYIFGRFEYKVDARAKLVFRVTLDGKVIAEQGTGLPYGVFSGRYDTVLFRYPGTVRANKDGNHLLNVKYGLITGIAESALGLLEWGQVRTVNEADFTIKLLPHQIQD